MLNFHYTKIIFNIALLLFILLADHSCGVTLSNSKICKAIEKLPDHSGLLILIYTQWKKLQDFSYQEKYKKKVFSNKYNKKL